MCAQESAKERGEQAGALAEARARAAAHEEKAIGQAATIHEQAEHNRSLEVLLRDILMASQPGRLSAARATLFVADQALSQPLCEQLQRWHARCLPTRGANPATFVQQAALKQANRRADDLRAAAAAAEARERDSAAQVDRANGIIERLTVRSRPPRDPSQQSHTGNSCTRSAGVCAQGASCDVHTEACESWNAPQRRCEVVVSSAGRGTSASRRRRRGGGRPS